MTKDKWAKLITACMICITIVYGIVLVAEYVSN